MVHLSEGHTLISTEASIGTYKIKCSLYFLIEVLFPESKYIRPSCSQYHSFKTDSQLHSRASAGRATRSSMKCCGIGDKLKRVKSVDKRKRMKIETKN